MLAPELSSKYLESQDIKFVEAKIMDPFGELRTKLFRTRKYDSIKEDGFRVDGSSIGYANVERSDMHAKLIEDPYIIIPEFNTAVFLCELYDDGKPCEYFGRNILKKTLSEFPYKVGAATETEFYLTTPDRKPLDHAVYMGSAPSDTSDAFKKEFMLLAEKANPDFALDVINAEVGPSQHEFELPWDINPVRHLDMEILARDLLKKFAVYKGIRATTMPKPLYGMAGNGKHLHLSYWDGGTPVFYQNSEEISDIAKKAIGGILRHARKNAIFTNNTINSYKRLEPNHEVPLICVWGLEQRTALVRIPKENSFVPEKLTMEVRNLDHANDPNIAVAAILEASKIGMRGGDEFIIPEFEGCTYQLTPKQLEEQNIERLPTSLWEAIELAGEEDSIPRRIHKRLDKFLEAKKNEAMEYDRAAATLKRNGIDSSQIITDWEYTKYFDR